jgi:1,4-dihydroxy-2-naphthoate octaprenyltransferase
VIAWFRSLAQRDLRAILALAFSILGTVALTAVAVWIVWILWHGGWPISTAPQRIDKLGLALVLVLVIMGVTMVSLGLAINRREVKASAFGASFEASGGDDPVSTVAAAAAQGAAAGAVQASKDQGEKP